VKPQEFGSGVKKYEVKGIYELELYLVVYFEICGFMDIEL
jgi:hypothetical protein